MKCKYIVFFILCHIYFFLTCQGLEKLVQAPVVRIAEVQMNNINFEAVSLTFDILVDNRNPFGITITKYDYRFSLENTQLFSNEEAQNLVIGAQNQNHVHVPLTIKFSNVFELIHKTKNLDSLNYSFEGHILPGGILSTFNIPFSKTGSLPNVRIPELSLQGLKITKLSFSGMDIDLIIRLKNPNSFRFDINNLNYNIQIKEIPVASGFTEKAASIPAKGKGDFRLPIKLNFLGAAASLQSILSTHAVDCTVSGRANLLTPFGNLEFPIDAKQNIPVFK